MQKEKEATAVVDKRRKKSKGRKEKTKVWQFLLLSIFDTDIL